MGTVILGWNPEEGVRWSADYADLVQRTVRGRGVLARWPVEAGHVPPVGTAAHLALQGRARGLLGRGTVRSAPFLSADPRRPGHVTPHVLVEWSVLLPQDQPIDVATLHRAVPECDWRGSNCLAQALPDSVAGRLDRVWASHPLGSAAAPVVPAG